MRNRKLFIYRPTEKSVDCASVAYTPDGHAIGWHISSGLGWAKRDMKRFCGGYDEVEWIIGRKSMQKKIDSGEITGISFEVGEVLVEGGTE